MSDPQSDPTSLSVAHQDRQVIISTYRCERYDHGLHRRIGFKLSIRIVLAGPITVGHRPGPETTSRMPRFCRCPASRTSAARCSVRRRRQAKDVVGNNSPFCTKELGCTARRKTRRLAG